MEINNYHFNIPESIKVILNNYQDAFLPKKAQIFKALQLTNFYDVKVVILGQDPYPNKQDANGLAFSVDRDYNLPKSLLNIFKALEIDLDIKKTNGDLTSWAKQGVLLLNSYLTIDTNNKQAHLCIGWEEITDKIIGDLSKRGHVIFVLLGNFAKSKVKLINQEKNIIITAPHPSPLSAYRGFFNAHIFTKINQALVEYNYSKINW